MPRHGARVLQFFVFYLITLAYERLFNAHLLLSQTILAEGDHEGARAFVENVLPYVSRTPQHRAAFLSVVVKSWIGSE